MSSVSHVLLGHCWKGSSSRGLITLTFILYFYSIFFSTTKFIQFFFYKFIVPHHQFDISINSLNTTLTWRCFVMCAKDKAKMLPTNQSFFFFSFFFSYFNNISYLYLVLYSEQENKSNFRYEYLAELQLKNAIRNIQIFHTKKNHTVTWGFM